jgi:uncharacterized alpha-E superfamily protein
VLSRVAEHIYWLARYVERAEDTARLINVASQLQLDLPKSVRPGWGPIVAITGSGAAFQQHYRDLTETAVVAFLIEDRRNPSSILQSLHWARENARTVRDFLPREGWEQLNDLHRMAQGEIYLGLSARGRFDFLKRIILGAQAFTGLLSGTMNHDEGYGFLRIGRHLERADMTTRIIDVLTADLLPAQTDLGPFHNIQRMSVLNALGAYQMYRRQMQQPVGWTPVLNFLLKNRQLPRAFLHCLGETAGALEALLHHQQALAVARRIEAELLALDPHHIGPAELHALIDQLQRGLGELHQAIGETYFNHAQVAVQRQAS